MPASPARRRMAFETVGSTNNRAMEAARAGDPGSLWVTADEQSEGRGRRGRGWSSPPGNLFASLLVIEPSPMEHLGNLPLVVAVGVRNGLAALPGLESTTIGIKWPNDVLADGAKCVGILIESERLASGANAVVIGCGVNLEHAPQGQPYAVTSLRERGANAGVEEAFVALAGGVEDALRLWDRGRGFSDIRQEWLAHARGVGEACRVNLPDRLIEGRFVELDARGRLVLEKADGSRETISAGDVFFANADGAAAPQ